MKKSNLLFLLIIYALFACTQELHYIRPVESLPKKSIILPDKGMDPSLKPYVVNGKKYYPLPDSEGFSQTGKASWYGSEFHGRSTSSGEIYNMHNISAAHKTLPLGTYVKVVNLSNKKEVVVRINDRGPFVKGRIIDLSYAAAKEVDLVDSGVAEVKVIALGREIGELKSSGSVRPVVEINDPNKGDFTIQVGAFRNRENATNVAHRLKVLFDYTEIVTSDDPKKGRIYKVWVSRSSLLSEAVKIEKRLEKMGFEEAFILSF